MNTLLLIDDDPLIRDSLRLTFEEVRERGEHSSFRVLTASTAAEGLELAAQEHPAVVLLDVQLPDGHGVELIGEIHRIAGNVPVVVITGHHDTATTIRAMKAGAFDYLNKPFVDPEALLLVVDRSLAMARLSRQATLAVSSGPPARLDDLIGSGPAMQRVLKEIGKVAASQAAVLLQGESGTGKELVAKVIHAHSSDTPRPFVAINCSAVVETLLESEFFGHERGSFTGAVAAKVGKFELAEDGTLFLDEIGDMPLSLQTKLLRVLQEREFERVGGLRRLPLRARVIAASHRDLAAEVARGRFRDDLYQRLKVMTLTLPALRERIEDLPELVANLLQRINAKVHRRVTRVPDAVMTHLKTLPWPGNVRELENVLTRAVVLAAGDVLMLDTLPGLATGAAPIAEPLSSEPEPLLTLAEVERRQIGRAILLCNGHKGRICQALGISRPTLERKLQKYRLSTERPPLADPLAAPVTARDGSGPAADDAGWADPLKA